MSRILTGTEVNKEFARLAAADPSNLRCFDCNTQITSGWCSVSHGTYMCISCIGEHRGYGVHISFCRSATMDEWNEKQMAHMQKGGNARCAAMFQQYDISRLPKREKYHTRGAQYYRDLLNSEVEGLPAPEILPFEKGAEALPVFTRQNISADPIFINPNSNSNNNSTSRWGVSWGALKSGFTQAMTTASVVVADVSLNVSSTIANNQVLSSIQQSAQEGVVTLKVKLSEVTEKVNENEHMKNIKSGISLATQSVSKGVDDVLGKILRKEDSQDNEEENVQVIDNAFENAQVDFDRVPSAPASQIDERQGDFVGSVVLQQRERETAQTAPVMHSMIDDDDDAMFAIPPTGKNLIKSAGNTLNADDFFDSLDVDVANGQKQKKTE
eukprot:GDKJ01013189.1.p1 GENE.GDKJ01013189.1~~GDKJ01013189.1.p1  ORF type:complete len:384 (-),score=93.90 GDKJ01013189.1:386-1537(-)